MYSLDHMVAEDGKKVYVHKWIPDKKKRGIVLISHGISEHGGRYGHFADFLNTKGYVVYSQDHRAHGLTAGNRLGTDDTQDTFVEIVKDMRLLNQKARNEHEGLKVVQLGHSMGSFLSLRYAEAFPDSIDALVLSGNNGPGDKGSIMAGAAISRALISARGRHSRGDIINNMMFGKFGSKIKDKRTEFDWISRDAEQVDKYVEDPFCGIVMSNGFYGSMLSNLLKVYDKEELSRIRKDLPVLIASGTDDPVGNMGNGPIALARLLDKTNGNKNLFVRLYKGARHEILNETNREEVYGDILKFADMHI
ncbi:alpha/beta fold hydrolase [Youngiibacter fragilis]|uniref:Alpha/beta hydrolase n=1 Tax=Youngiibacter fragilis 232.1 TaxID=994573 RepID=V7I927_9CLOT|nr:alpha/beta hydrolase [Youngiibacter fragilis]ETA81759.1 alpha/beta hydrolase [Youngiibacter fragilis 232.1]